MDAITRPPAPRKRIDVVQPHRHAHVLGTTGNATHEDAKSAVAASLRAADSWRNMPFDERAAILLRAADLLSGPWRDLLNAATMLGQSKTAVQAFAAPSSIGWPPGDYA